MKLDAHFGTAGPGRLNCRHPDPLGRACHRQLHLIGAEHWALSGLENLTWDLSGMVGAKIDVNTIADCPLEELRFRVWPVLRRWAEGCRRLKGGGFSRLISAGRAGKGRDVMESGVSVTMAF
jgi:hypothetical protein